MKRIHIFLDITQNFNRTDLIIKAGGRKTSKVHILIKEQEKCIEFSW